MGFMSSEYVDPNILIFLSLSHDLPIISPTIWTINVTNIATTSLDKVEDFLTWKTQFLSLLVMHQLHGFLNESPTHATSTPCHHVSWCTAAKSNLSVVDLS